MKKFPISEIFGPTIQGEGIHIGRRTSFIRFAGCDTKCEWCDTKYAWEPKVHMTEYQIIQAVTPARAPIITITGGNPALYELDNLCERLFLTYHEVHVETQGTIWKDWLHRTSFISVSPKPHHLRLTVLNRITKLFHDRCQIKIVIFSKQDLTFLEEIYAKYPHVPFIVQIGWPDPESRYWIANYVADNENLGKNVRVLPQLHRIYWGNEKGV